MNYILDEHDNPVACPDIERFANFFNDAKRRLLEVTQVGRFRVSTVFLGVDMSYGRGGGPILWETLIFGPDGRTVDEYGSRYASRAGALAGHQHFVEVARGLEAGLEPEPVDPPHPDDEPIDPPHVDEPDQPDDGAETLELERQRESDLEDSD